MNNSKKTVELQTEKFVTTGCLATGSKDGIIKTSPLGSCVAVIVYDKTTKVGGIAHVMLPGKSPEKNEQEKNKYAENAIKNLLKELSLCGASQTKLEICLVGGANVLKKENDKTPDQLVFSIFEIIKQQKLTVIKSHLGGYERRTASLNLSSGTVSYTVGDCLEQKLI